ncbi:MAG: YedE-related selenium metabolism membrane protein [Dehalococcoidia bacterium]|nr:MAG: YedE-related selenium metabolism membrane protein [Dehalococcoidia bacterium]
MKLLLTPRFRIIIAGLVFGVLAALMTNWGNPPNMGICVACFLRDVAGALGLHRAAVVQYLRPEIIGFLLGAFITAYAFGEFRSRGGASPLVRFILGALVMIGALVFLGCPIRMMLRIAGGDLNGMVALAGLITGVLVGILFLKRGFNLGRATRIHPLVGWTMPALMLGLLLLAIFKPGFIFASETGPGAMYAPLAVSLVIGLVVSFLAQRTRMCFVGAWRDVFLVRDFYLLSGVIAFFIAALVTNYVVGNFGATGIYHWGFTSQPIAHDNHLWNFLGMGLLGLAATLIGGCPLRNLILAGEGDTDAGVTVLGFLAGAAIAHNFLLASSPNGTGAWGPLAVTIGLVFCVIIGLVMRE